MSRKISAGKAREILEEPADLSVFLKGVVSPYAWVNCDIIEEGRKIGLLQEDRQNRVFTIDLDKNCPDDRREGAPPSVPV
ncbi:MAG: hypothetical protein H8D78_00205 [Chloroflexi bacterium]|nr:hypothetical protein [Chloroflexota bacterium]